MTASAAVAAAASRGLRVFVTCESRKSFRGLHANGIISASTCIMCCQYFLMLNGVNFHITAQKVCDRSSVNRSKSVSQGKEVKFNSLTPKKHFNQSCINLAAAEANARVICSSC